jgi:nucleotidyltransferase substrate binding protein (TIGR01987 family)
MDAKIGAQLNDLESALNRLQDIFKFPPTQEYKDATIQRFEFCFELSWKLMQSIARSQNKGTPYIKASFREAAHLGLIDDPELWFEFHDARNLSSHVYNEAMANQVYEKAKEFLPEAKKMLEKARETG